MPYRNRAEVLNRLSGFPARLAAAARAAAAADAEPDGPPAGEWTALENVAHLVAVERSVWHARLDGLEASAPGSEPVWAWAEPGPAGDAVAAGLERALALFGQERQSTMGRLAALDEPGWARTGLHATYGRLDVAGLAGTAADHDEEHIAAMAKGRPGVPRRYG